MSKIEVNTVEPQCGTTLTLGGSGDTVTLGSGASQSGFGRAGSVNWQTSIKTATFTAASGEGYFCNTSGGAFTVNLPSSPSVGDIVAIKDYGSSFQTNNLTIGRGGSNMNGDASDSIRTTENESLTLVYADATKGWLSVEEGTGFVGQSFITATGGNSVVTSGDFKIHTFTGPGTFSVSSISNNPTLNKVDYLVVAGGGGGGAGHGGGGGAGGFRYYLNTTNSPTPAFPASPLNNFPSGTAVTVTATDFPIVVGGGGAQGSPGPGNTPGGNGNPSSFSTITSTAGGFGSGAQSAPSYNGGPGGSGGGAGTPYPSGSVGTVGSGNTPPTTPAQGTDGGAAKYGGGWISSGGGGGGISAGTASPVPQGGPSPDGLTNPAGLGGAGGGFTSNVFGPGNGECSSCVQYFAGGGGGGGSLNSPSAPAAATNPAGGLGGGGNGGSNSCSPSPNPAATAGDANTGGGGGGGGAALIGEAGGSGIVVIRYKFQ